jgi:hypothetical protein
MRKIFKKIPYIEALRAFLEQWGIWSYLSVIGGAMIAAAYALWAWLESHLPYWAIALIFLFTLMLVVVLMERIHALVVRQRVRNIDIPAQSKWMKGVVRDMRQTLSDLRAHAAAITPSAGASERDILMRQHRERIENQRRISTAFYQKHGGEIMAAFRIIETVAEGQVLIHTKVSLSSEPMTAVAFMDAAAHLMATGNIDEMKKLDDEFMFHLGAS